MATNSVVTANKRIWRVILICGISIIILGLVMFYKTSSNSFSSLFPQTYGFTSNKLEVLISPDSWTYIKFPPGWKEYSIIHTEGKSFEMVTWDKNKYFIEKENEKIPHIPQERKSKWTFKIKGEKGKIIITI